LLSKLYSSLSLAKKGASIKMMLIGKRLLDVKKEKKRKKKRISKRPSN
jgi:hypothetical protein